MIAFGFENANAIFYEDAKLARRGYSAGSTRPVSARAQEAARLLEQLPAIHTKSRQPDGHRRSHADLRYAGATCGKGRVARLMRHGKLVARLRRKPRRTTGSCWAEPVAPDLRDRQVAVPAPGSGGGARHRGYRRRGKLVQRRRGRRAGCGARHGAGPPPAHGLVHGPGPGPCPGLPRAHRGRAAPPSGPRPASSFGSGPSICQARLPAAPRGTWTDLPQEPHRPLLG